MQAFKGRCHVCGHDHSFDQERFQQLMSASPAAAADGGDAKDAEMARLTCQTHDLVLLVLRMARRLKSAASNETRQAGNEALADQAVEYLRQQNLTSPLRDESN